MRCPDSEEGKRITGRILVLPGHCNQIGRNYSRQRRQRLRRYVPPQRHPRNISQLVRTMRNQCFLCVWPQSKMSLLEADLFSRSFGLGPRREVCKHPDVLGCLKSTGLFPFKCREALSDWKQSVPTLSEQPFTHNVCDTTLVPAPRKRQKVKLTNSGRKN